MKNYFILFLSIVCLSLGTNTASAQGEEGTITLEITDISSDNPQIAQMAEMMKGTQTIVHFKAKESLTKMNMMGGMVMIDIKLSEEGASDMLFNAMGQKFWVQSTKAEQDRISAENPSPFKDMDITYDENDKKKIAGFNCFKMMAKSKEADDVKFEAYVTTEIKINAAVAQGIDITKFKGFPLEYSISANNMKMTVSTKDFKNSVASGAMALKTDGFTKLSLEQFMEKMGNMGGFGF